MPDNRQRPKDRKLSLIAPALLALALIGILVAGYLLNQHRPPETPPAAQAPPTSIAPPPVIAPETLGRSDLIAAVHAAAAAYTAPEGAAAASPETLLDREFRLRVAFACHGAQGRPLGAQAFTEYDPQARTLRLIAQPSSWTGLPLAEAIESGGKVEAVEGFWLPRPWNTTEGCPQRRATVAAPNPTAPATQTLGLAQAFEMGGSRLLRRGDRPYEFVRRIPETEAATLAHSYWLVLEGQVTGFGEGSPFRCWQESPDHRPICLLGVNFSRVAFEDAATNAVLAEWRE